MQTFEMFRGKDESGISGTGRVVQGVIFDSGACVVTWLCPNKPNSIELWRNFGEFVDIHITKHPTNRTKIVFSDGRTLEY